MVMILVGMIASGKSTWANRATRGGAVIISEDSIVNAVHANSYNLYDKKLKSLYKATEECIFSNAVACGRDVVIDKTNTSAKARRRWIGLAKSRDLQVGTIEFPNEGPTIHARRRFEKDSRGYSLLKWTEAAERHDKDWVKPDLSEGLDFIGYSSDCTYSKGHLQWKTQTLDFGT